MALGDVAGGSRGQDQHPVFRLQIFALPTKPRVHRGKLWSQLGLYLPVTLIQCPTFVKKELLPADLTGKAGEELCKLLSAGLVKASRLARTLRQSRA